MATGAKGQRPSEAAVPPNMASRLEKSRKLAQKRRETYKDLMTSLADELPFSKEVVSQVDYNSRLRLALCFFRMKSLGGVDQLPTSQKMIEHSPKSKPVSFQPGVLQELMIEAMDGFLMVILSDGTIVYLSESVHKHLGLFQSEHMGFSLYDLVLEEDHNDVKEAIAKAEARAHARMGTKCGAMSCSFFCRMKCSRFKVANTQMKSPGYKVVHVNGHFRLQGTDPFLVVLVKPVTPPSILEIRMEGNMFVTHYALDMKCIFFDGRLSHLMGYKRKDLEGKPVFDFHHHDDTEATVECSKGIQARGEGLSGYFRMLTRYGTYVWLQTRATMMFDSRTGQPSYIVCMNFLINKDTGDRRLAEKRALMAPPEADTKSCISEEGSKSHDPFPIPREDGRAINPLDEEGESPVSTTSVEIKSEVITPPLSEEPSSTTTPLKSQRQSHSSVTSTGPHSTSDAGQFHSGEDCVPDSTTSTASPHDKQQSSHPMSSTDQGYNSHHSSSSSFHSSNVFSPTVELVGSSYSSTPKSVNTPTQPNTVFSQGSAHNMPQCSVTNSGNETSSSGAPIQNWNQTGTLGVQQNWNQGIGMGHQSPSGSSGTSSLSSSVAPPPLSSTAAESGRVFASQQMPGHAPQTSSIPLSFPSVSPPFPSSLPPTAAQFSQGTSATPSSSSVYQDPIISELQDTKENYHVPQPLHHQGFPHGGQAQSYQAPPSQQVYYQQPMQGGTGTAMQVDSQRLQHFDQLTHPSGGQSAASAYNLQYTSPYIKEEPPAVPSACRFASAPHAPDTFGSLHHQMGQPLDSALAPNFNFGQQQLQQNGGFVTTPSSGMGHAFLSGGYQQQNSGFGTNPSAMFGVPPADGNVIFTAGKLPPNQTAPPSAGVPLQGRQFDPSTAHPSSSSAFLSSSSSAHPQNMMTSSVMFGDATATGVPQMTNQTAGLPLLTGEDLKVLDFVEQLDAGGSITQMPNTYSQLYTTH